ncbi:MAG: ferritin family protein [Dehalococcoidales bacterium]|nr:ferritin family protein [Dehalococcoidales bacterium]
MATEQDKTVAGLQIAIQMEIDGQEFYLKAAKASRNDLGRKLLQRLAAEEDIHRQKFEQIYEDISRKKGWPVVDFQPDGGKTLRTVFARALEEGGARLKARASELAAVKTAREMEAKTYDFYQSQSKKATYDAERNYYETLAGEEQEHSLILADYYEYLQNPAGWFVKKEHPSLDGS